MSERAAIRTLILVAMNVGISFPLSTQAQSLSEIEVGCDDKDALQSAIAAITPGGNHHPFGHLHWKCHSRW